MSKSSIKKVIPSCGCPQCRCHDYNALLALALWEFGRMIRRQRSAK